VAFLTGQVDAFLPILRSDTGTVSLAATQETAMLVNILYQILRTRNSTVSVSTALPMRSRLMGVYSLVQALLADLKVYEHSLKALCYKYFSPERWMSSVVPLTQKEHEQSATKFGEWQIGCKSISVYRGVLQGSTVLLSLNGD
jgi:hypothetical protein